MGPNLVSLTFLRYFARAVLLVVAFCGGSATLSAQTAADVDIYGGSTALKCSNPSAAHFYTEKIGDRWWLCTPLGNVFWMRSVYHVDGNDEGLDHQGLRLVEVIRAKYGNTGTKWGPPTVKRLRSWGFNATAEFSSTYVEATTSDPDWGGDFSNPEKMAFAGLVWPAHYSRNRGPYAGVEPVKELVGPIKESVYRGQRRKTPDVFDLNYAKWMREALRDFQNQEHGWVSSRRSDYVIGLNVDETDELFGFGAGPDFKGLINGFPDDFTHTHLGWVTLVTASSQASGIDANGNPITYTDTKVYAKQGLSDWLAARYNGDITQLNLAWGSNYSTFGSNGGWGNGDGLLDEDGTHTWVPRDFLRLSDAVPAVQRDLDDFLLFYARQYFSMVRGVLQTEAPGIMYLGPTNLGSWGSPPRRQILQAASDYVDVIGLAPTPTVCYACADDQDRINFVALWGGDKPWMNWVGIPAQPDSYMSPFPIPATAEPDATTQAMRAERFRTMTTKLMDAKDSATGTHHNVGYKWWQYYDSRGQQANWGLVTPRDNAYDGRAAIRGTGTDDLGYPRGGEQADYGDFLSGVTSANQNIYPYLIPLP